MSNLYQKVLSPRSKMVLTVGLVVLLISCFAFPAFAATIQRGFGLDVNRAPNTFVLSSAGQVSRCNPSQNDSDWKFWILGANRSLAQKNWSLYAASSQGRAVISWGAIYGYFPDNGTPWICVGTRALTSGFGLWPWEGAKAAALFTSTAIAQYR